MRAEGKSTVIALRLIWKLFSPELKSERKSLSIGILFELFGSSLGLLIPLMIEKIIDESIPAKDIHAILKHSLIILLLLGGGYILWYVHLTTIARASENVFKFFKLRFSESILKKQISFFKEYASADILTRLVNDMELISDFFYKYLIKSVVLLIFSVVVIVYIFILNWHLSVIAIIGFPLYFILIYLFDKPITRASRKSKEKLSIQNQLLLDLLEGHKVIRFFQQIKLFINKLDEKASEYAEANRVLKIIMHINETMLQAFGVIIVLMPIVFGGILIALEMGGITIGIIIAFQAYLLLISQVITEISNAIAELIKIKPSLDRIDVLMDYPEEDINKTIEIHELPETYDIEFKNVSFSYIKGKRIIHDFNLRIKEKEKVCIMGDSGRGKTTLVNLLLRFIEPDEGEIFFGGKNIASYPLNSYLFYFSYVWQETYLFKLSIKDNISLGWYQTPEDEITSAIERVGLKSVIESLPNQYDTIFGMHDFDFSGGQRQRLALARAIIRDPEILVLDEFTSAVDRETEEKILSQVFDIFDSHTIICITHSESVAKRFNRVVKI